MKAFLAAVLVLAAPFTAAQERAAAAAPVRVDALVALARTYGVVRYYHPSDSLDAVKWDRFLVHAAARMGSVSSAAEIAPRLEELFGPIVEGFRVLPAGAAIAAAPAGDGPVIEWRHLGYGLETDATLPYASWRTHHGAVGEGRNQRGYFQHQTPGEKPVQAEPVMRVSLPQGLEAQVAVSLPRSAVRVGEAQRARLQELDAALAKVEVAGAAVDRAQAQADGIAAWNLAAHFYPYWSMLSIDWDAKLRDWLASQPASQDRPALVEQLRRLTAPLDDGHALFVDAKNPPVRRFLRFSMRPLGKGCVVDASLVDNVKRGDVLVAVDGKAAAAWYAERAARTSGSAQRKAWTVCTELLWGAPDSTVSLRLRRGNANVDVKLVRDAERGLGSPRAEQLQEVKPGIRYLDVARFDKPAFDKALESLRDARGIIFDLRGLPTHEAHVLAGYWVTEKDAAQWMFVPRFDRPFAKWSDEWSFGWQKAQDAALAKPMKVALIDGRTFDYAESLAAYFPAQRTGPLVGEASAGSNGNAAHAALPSGVRFYFTSMRVTRHDGTPYHRDGLEPDEAVVPTLAGIAAGHDEALDRAISLIEKSAPR